MKKRVDEGKIQSELAQSVFFKRKKEKVIDMSPKISVERPLVRRGFDVHQDQLVALQGVQYKKMCCGERRPGLSEMIRAAIDLYIMKIESDIT